MNNIDKAIKACREEIKFYKDELKDPRFKEHLSPEEDYCKGRSETYCRMQASIETFEFIISVLKEQQQRRWIPVSERLPDKDDVYLATFEENGKRYTERFYFSTMNSWYMPVVWQDEGRIEEILAWQPLPEPYKEETK